MIRLSRCFVLLVALVTVLTVGARPIELEDLFQLKRVSDPPLSRDGTQVVYVVTEILKDEKK